jgi:hypothetical protein
VRAPGRSDRGWQGAGWGRGGGATQLAEKSWRRHTGLNAAISRRVGDLIPLHEEYWFQIYGKIALTGEPARFENAAAQLGRHFDVYAFRVGDPATRSCGVACA